MIVTPRFRKPRAQRLPRMGAKSRCASKLRRRARASVGETARTNTATPIAEHAAHSRPGQLSATPGVTAIALRGIVKRTRTKSRAGAATTAPRGTATLFAAVFPAPRDSSALPDGANPARNSNWRDRSSPTGTRVLTAAAPAFRPSALIAALAEGAASESGARARASTRSVSTRRATAADADALRRAGRLQADHAAERRTDSGFGEFVLDGPSLRLLAASDILVRPWLKLRVLSRFAPRDGRDAAGKPLEPGALRRCEIALRPGARDVGLTCSRRRRSAVSPPACQALALRSRVPTSATSTTRPDHAGDARIVALTAVPGTQRVDPSQHRPPYTSTSAGWRVPARDRPDDCVIAADASKAAKCSFTGRTLRFSARAGSIGDGTASGLAFRRERRTGAAGLAATA